MGFLARIFKRSLSATESFDPFLSVVTRARIFNSRATSVRQKKESYFLDLRYLSRLRQRKDLECRCSKVLHLAVLLQRVIYQRIDLLIRGQMSSSFLLLGTAKLLDPPLLNSCVFRILNAKKSDNEREH